jgi:transcriptional regulator GlxA family with amidase domain
VALSARRVERGAFRDLQTWIVEHLEEPLRVEDLAARAAMSPRNFARAFAAEIGVTPARYVLLQRIEAAKAQLEQSARGQDEIAAACGFGAVEQMRRAFLRELNTTPGRYRDHFRRKPGRITQRKVRAQRALML